MTELDYHLREAREKQPIPDNKFSDQISRSHANSHRARRNIFLALARYHENLFNSLFHRS